MATIQELIAQSLGDKAAHQERMQKAQLDVQRIGVEADARLANTRAGLLPTESAANVDNTRANTALTRENTKFVGPLANASIWQSAAQARNLDADTGLTTENTRSARSLNERYGTQLRSRGLISPNADAARTAGGLFGWLGDTLRSGGGR